MHVMKKMTFALPLLLLLGLGSQVEAAQVSIGITIGRPPAPRVVRVAPRRPGVGFVWVEGYWYPDHKHYRWHDGYWTRPPYAGAVWVTPRYDRNMYYVGYWQQPRARVEHDRYGDRGRGRGSDRDDRPGRDGRRER